MKRRRTTASSSSSSTIHHDRIPTNTPIVPVAGQWLSSLISPLNREEFISQVRFQKAMVVKGRGPNALKDFIQQHFHGGDVKDLVFGSASLSHGDGISVWLPPDHDGTATAVESYKVSDANFALALHTKKCASLYMRAAHDTSDLLTRMLSLDLGRALSLDDNMQSLGEVEVFLSHPGSFTPPHSDFQENFTLQLQGSKRWFLRQGPVKANPVRGITPQFKDVPLDVIEQQLACLRAAQAAAGAPVHGTETWPPDLDPKNPSLSLYEIVDLEPGDFLYHPPGIFHAVQTIGTETSLSINMSLHSVSFAQVVADAVFTRLLAFNALRAPASHERRDIENVDEALASAGIHLGFPSVAYAFPPGPAVTGEVDGDDDDDNPQRLWQAGQQFIDVDVFVPTYDDGDVVGPFVRSPLCILVWDSDLQDSKEEEQAEDSKTSFIAQVVLSSLDLRPRFRTEVINVPSQICGVIKSWAPGQIVSEIATLGHGSGSRKINRARIMIEILVRSGVLVVQVPRV